MRMKRSSFVCVGAQGGSDALVYQEIPGRGSGEEFFLFFSPGTPRQEPILRTLFREAVSASRLGAPLHYFSRLIEQYGALAAEARVAAGPGVDAAADDPLAGAVIFIQIRRGEESHVLCNRDAAAVHWDADAGAERPLPALPGFAEIPLAPSGEQRDLFERGPADCFALYRFDMSTGAHTLVVLPSRDFAERHRESLRDSVFFPSFELPGEQQIAVPAERSFPALHWRGAATPRPAAPRAPREAQRRALRVPIAAAGAVAMIAVVVLIAVFAGTDRQGPGRVEPRLAAADAVPDSSRARDDRGRDGERVRPGSLAEAWRKEFRGAVTSSPRCFDGVVYVGCRDGNLYAFGPEGDLVWKHRASDGIGASPLVLDDRVVCADYRGEVFCLARKTGALLWKRGVRAKVVASPVAADGAVYVAGTNGAVTALRLKDGSRLWERSIGRSIRATPTAGSGYVVASTTDGTIARLDRRGAVVWRASAGAEIPSSPLIVEDRDLVIVGTRNRSLRAFSLGTGARAWAYAAGAEVSGAPALAGTAIVVGTRDGAMHAVGLDGGSLWKSAVGGAILSKPLVAGGIVYATTYGSRLVALDATNGGRLGEFKASSPIYSSPDHDGKHIYFGSNGGVLYAVRLSPPA